MPQTAMTHKSMQSSKLEVHQVNLSKEKGSSPAEDRFYTVVLFDISEPKKYRAILKVLKSYSSRIQYSIFEAYLKPAQVREMLERLHRIMASERFFNVSDRLRIYRIAGNCELTVFGTYEDNAPEQNVFI